MSVFHILWVVLFAALGGAFMSFFGVLTSRGLAGESVGGRSHCACGRQLAWYENVPVFGWLRVRGRAKCCGARIPSYYFITELVGAIAWGVLGWYAAGFLMQNVSLPIVVLAATGACFVLMVGLIYLHFAVRKEA